MNPDLAKSIALSAWQASMGGAAHDDAFEKAWAAGLSVKVAEACKAGADEVTAIGELVGPLASAEQGRQRLDKAMGAARAKFLAGGGSAQEWDAVKGDVQREYLKGLALSDPVIDERLKQTAVTWR